MKKLYTKPEVDLIDLTAKESLMVTEHGYPGTGFREDYYFDATSVNDFYKYDDILWDE